MESFATARIMSSGWSALGSGLRKLPKPTRPTMPRAPGALAMRATAAAPSRQAAASLVRVRIIALPVGPTDEATPGAGARSLQHRVSSYAFTALRLEPEHQQRAAGVRHVRVVAERADRAQRRRRILGPDAERHTGAGPATDP